MAIDAYTGLPRSGKSYSVIKNVILPSLKEGRQVHTNIPLTDLLKEEFPGQCHQLPDDWYTSETLFDDLPPGAVVVLDELWRRWPAGLKANRVPFADKAFLAEHGHNVDEHGRTTRVVLVTQDLSQIAAFARDLVDTTYRSVKLDQVGADGRFRVDIYRGAVTGQKPPKTQLTRSLYDKYEEEIYRYYKSATKSQAGNAGDESRADKRANIWRSPFILFALIAPIVCIPFLLWYIIGMFSSGFGLVEEPPAPEPVVLTNPPPPVVNPPPGVVQVQQVTDSRPPMSGVWRIAGTMDWPSRDQAKPVIILVSGVLGERYANPDDCEILSDGINWSCVVDGFTVTAWTGRGDYSTIVSPPALARTARVASGATDPGSAQPVNPPPVTAGL